MTFSQFARYLSEMRGRIPSTILREVRAEALERYKQRLAEGRADAPLVFSDLFDRCEQSLFR